MISCRLVAFTAIVLAAAVPASAFLGEPPEIRRIVNAAGDQDIAPADPGPLISGFGSNLAPESAAVPADEDGAPLVCRGTELCIGDLDAPLLFINPSQINAQVPAGTSTGVPDKPIPLSFAGAQCGYPGLDQIYLRLSSELAGSGVVELALTVNDEISNRVRIQIR